MIVLMLVFVVMFMHVGVAVFVRVHGQCALAAGHIMAMLLLAVDHDLHMGTADAAGGGGPGRNCYAGEQVVHRVKKAGLIVQQLVEGSYQHVAGGAHIAFKIQCFHAFALSI